jgi:hypothetical protein
MGLKLVSVGLLVGSCLLQAQYGTPVTVPFVGCETVGPMGSASAPGGTSMDVAINPALTDQLAFYQAQDGQGVLAPRGWHCVAMYGAGTVRLVVMPQIDRASAVAGKLQVSGSAVEVESAEGKGGGAGAVAVAALSARLFPVRQDWALQTLKDAGLPAVAGPFPHDVLTYQNDVVVQFRTPANQDGFGTERFGRGAEPIDGVALLMDQDSVLVQVRFPEAMRKLTTSILKQVEQDVASRQW